MEVLPREFPTSYFVNVKDDILLEILDHVGVTVEDQDKITVTFDQFLLMMREVNNYDKDKIDSEKMMEYIKSEEYTFNSILQFVNFLDRVLDKDGDGKITRSEMKNFLLNLPDRMADSQMERFLQTVDAENKGFLLIEGRNIILYYC